MAGKGLYGQNQGNEQQQPANLAYQHWLDNQIAEGDVVVELRATMQHPHFSPVTAVLAETLRRTKVEVGGRMIGYSDHRIQMILGQASHGTKF